MNLKFKYFTDIDFLSLSKKNRQNNIIINCTDINLYSKVLEKFKQKKLNNIYILNIKNIKNKNINRIKKYNLNYLQKFYKLKKVFIMTQDIEKIKKIEYDSFYKNELIIYFDSYYTKHENFFIERIFKKDLNISCYIPILNIENSFNKYNKNFKLLKYNKSKNFNIKLLFDYLEYYIKNKNKFKSDYISKKRLIYEFFPKYLLNCNKHYDLNIPKTENYYLYFYEDFDNDLFLNFKKNIIYDNVSIFKASIEFLLAHYTSVFLAKIKKNKNIKQTETLNELIINFSKYKNFINILFKKYNLNYELYLFYLHIYELKFNIKGS